MADEYFEGLQQGETLNGFSVDNLYLNGKDEAIGARMIHEASGFTLDFFKIESVPQAFFWVNTPPRTNMGMPHTAEHLVLGKGNKGRYVASLEDMSLGQSTAYTSQLYTAYPFSSRGGNDVFFDLFGKKLDAFLNPDFSDEEIRREVCNIGVTVDPADGSLGLDEKGTIYTEMISAFEKHWYYLYGTMDKMIYGSNHPLTLNSGGVPDAIRDMTAEDMREFLARAYRLDNMGAIVMFPQDIAPGDLLGRLDAIISGLITDAGVAHTPQKVVLPAPMPDAEPGTVSISTFPGTNEQAPGHLLYTWPAQLELDLNDQLMCEIFLYCLGGSQTSNLYNKLVNSDTRVIDLGAGYVWTACDDNIGNAISVGIPNVKVEFVDKRQIAAVGRLIKEEIAAIAAYPVGSAELADFNARAASFLVQAKKSSENYLNNPPGFGQRGGSGGGWYGLMKDLEKHKAFRKSLLKKSQMEYAQAWLAKNENIWTGLIENWQLLSSDFYAVGCKADPTMLTRAVEEKEARLAAFTEQLKERYGLADDAAAIARYREQYDENTRIIEEEAARTPLPPFLDAPPMTYDPQLDYSVETVAGSIPLVVSNFSSMTASTVGLLMNMNVLPADKLIYLPLLPDLITDIGVTKDGQVVDYAAMSERLKNEVLSFRAYIASNPTTGRVELAVVGSGGNPQESRQALDWMQAGLFQPYLDKANLPRLRDLIDQNLNALRNRMKGSEEGWVNGPVYSYRQQENPLLLAGYCFLTQEHLMHRLKWRLNEAGSDAVGREVEQIFGLLGPLGAAQSRTDLITFASTFGEADPTSFESGPYAEFVRAWSFVSAETQDIVLEALADLASIMGDIPDQTAAADWAYLVAQMKNDLLFLPERALTEINEALTLLRHRGNTRMYVVSNPGDRAALMPSIEALAGQLDDAPVRAQTYNQRPLVLTRMQSRYPGLERPTYVGLINTNTRNGVFVFSAPCAGLTTTDEEKLLDYLAARLYGGGGAHSMFMKTWSAGLAYSNGLRSSETSGNIHYYAERCPDLSETMRFVVSELEKAPRDPKLADYAVAQTFSVNRGANSYNNRAASMAANLADGITPELVTEFRRRILDLRHKENFYDILHDRMEDVYGRILIGYGGPLADNPDGTYFIIGPEAQFESLTQFVAAAESPQDVYRIYPRDYWMTD